MDGCQVAGAARGWHQSSDHVPVIADSCWIGAPVYHRKDFIAKLPTQLAAQVYPLSTAPRVH
jgi:hypothetical protein